MIKSSEQILVSIRQRMAGFYFEPLESACTLAGLDGLLFQLHWLLADATGSLDEFTEARMVILESDPRSWQRVHVGDDFHKVVEDPSRFKSLIAEWQRLDALLGLELPAKGLE